MGLFNRKRKRIEVVGFATLARDSSQKIFHLVGFILIGFSLLAYGNVLIPPQLTNPAWEYEATAQLLDLIWAPILGLMLIFYRQYRQGDFIRQRTLWFLSFLSWLSLLAGIIYLLMIPLTIINADRLYTTHLEQVSTNVAQQLDQLDQARNQVESATNDQLLVFAANFSAQNPQANLGNLENPSEARTALLEAINTSQSDLQVEAIRARSTRKRQLFKSTLNIGLGLLLAAISHVWIWRLTDWVRGANRYGRFLDQSLQPLEPSEPLSK